MKQTALITGASGGIGLELAKLFAKNGHDLVLVARSGDKLTQIANELSKHNIHVQVLAKDLSDYNTVKEIFDYCNNNAIQIDYLVNNAGFGDFGMFYESNWKKQEQIINLNITALTYLTRLFLPAMVERKSGRIMNLASTAAFQPGPMMSVYYASKAYVLHFSEAIANELGKTGVTVTALCPGATESGFQAAAAMEKSRLVKGKKLPTSEEVAAFGYRAMMKGKIVAVPGLGNKMLGMGYRFLPRNWVVKVSRMVTDRAG